MEFKVFKIWSLPFGELRGEKNSYKRQRTVDDQVLTRSAEGK